MCLKNSQSQRKGGKMNYAYAVIRKFSKNLLLRTRHASSVIRCFIRQRILRIYPLPIEVIKYPDINFNTYEEDEPCAPIHLCYGDQLNIKFNIHTDDGMVLTERNLEVHYGKGVDIEINLTKMYRKTSQLINVTLGKPIEDAIKELMKLEELGILEPDKNYSVYYIKEE